LASRSQTTFNKLGPLLVNSPLRNETQLVTNNDDAKVVNEGFLSISRAFFFLFSKGKINKFFLRELSYKQFWQV